jgi:2-dehydro-3-deoxygluconokinase
LEASLNYLYFMILSFGEIILRLIPHLDQTWIKESKIECFVGGAELNVSFALSKWQLQTAYFTALPDNYMADEIIEYLQNHKINTSKIIKREGRLSTYYIPKGGDLKATGVIYDRSYSSLALLSEDEINFNQVFEGITWFHLSAICPALNESTAKLSLRLVEEASKRNITVSIDYNYRAKLWQYGKAPHDIMYKISQHCDVIMGNIWAMKSLVNIPLNEEAIEKKDYFEATKTCSNLMCAAFPKLKYLAFTYRFDQDPNNATYAGMLYHNGIIHSSNTLMINEVNDKVGSGDCFMSGLIYGIYNNWSPNDIINFSAKAAVNKLREYGDHTNTEVEQILNTIF